MHPAPGNPDLNGVALFYHPDCLQHDSGYGHPESPERLRGILAALRERGVGEDDLILPEPVDLALLAQVHDERYIAAVEQVARRGGGYWDADTLISPGSSAAALAAAGGAVAAVDAVMPGTPGTPGARAGLAPVRPQGHQAPAPGAIGLRLYHN